MDGDAGTKGDLERLPEFDRRLAVFKFGDETAPNAGQVREFLLCQALVLARPSDQLAEIRRRLYCCRYIGRRGKS